MFYWVVNTFCAINFVGGLILGGYCWNRFGNELKNIWDKISK